MPTLSRARFLYEKAQDGKVMKKMVLLTSLHGRVLLDNLADFSLVCGAILLEHVVGFGLRGRLGVGVIEQILDTQEDRLNCYGRAPGLFFVQNR